MNYHAYYAQSAALVVATPNPAIIGDQYPVRGILITATVAGNCVLKLDDGSTLTVALAVGTVILPLAVINVMSQTATASYWQLG